MSGSQLISIMAFAPKIMLLCLLFIYYHNAPKHAKLKSQTPLPSKTLVSWVRILPIIPDGP